MKIGDKVRILAPFDSLKGEFVIEDIIDGQYKVSGVDGLFDAQFLETV